MLLDVQNVHIPITPGMRKLKLKDLEVFFEFFPQYPDCSHELWGRKLQSTTHVKLSFPLHTSPKESVTKTKLWSYSTHLLYKSKSSINGAFVFKFLEKFT